MLELKHKNLNVWKRSMDLATQVYEMTEEYPANEQYGLISQLRRSAVSVPSNIAEGSARRSVKDRKHFYEIALSSAAEIDTQIELSIRLGFCSEDQLIELEESINHVFAMLSRLIQKTTEQIIYLSKGFIIALINFYRLTSHV